MNTYFFSIFNHFLVAHFMKIQSIEKDKKSSYTSEFIVERLEDEVELFYKMNQKSMQILALIALE